MSRPSLKDRKSIQCKSIKWETAKFFTENSEKNIYSFQSFPLPGMNQLFKQPGDISKFRNENGPNCGVTWTQKTADSVEIFLPQGGEGRWKNIPRQYCSVTRHPLIMKGPENLQWFTHTHSTPTLTTVPLKVKCYVRFRLQWAIYLFMRKYM